VAATGCVARVGVDVGWLLLAGGPSTWVCELGEGAELQAVNRTSTLLQSRLNTRRVNREWRILLFSSLVFFSIYYREAHG
jgi:hypothetical protein